MSRYKVNFFVNSNANFRSTNAEVIDLVDDYGYTEKEGRSNNKRWRKVKKRIWCLVMGYYRNRFSSSRNRRWSWELEKDGSMIKYAEIYKQNIQGEIRFIAKIYVNGEEIEDEGFSSSTFEETAKYVLKDCVISSYFDITEMEG